MKRIKAACITQTVCFSNHDGDTSEYAKKMICQEYEFCLIFQKTENIIVDERVADWYKSGFAARFLFQPRRLPPFFRK